MSISNAILWTHFVTPRGNQTQHDQTKRVSYYKKEESEELEYNESHSSLVGLYTSMLERGEQAKRVYCWAYTKVEINRVCLCGSEGLAGLSFAESMLHLCKLQDMLIWNGLFEPDGFFQLLMVGWLEKQSTHSCCLQRVMNVDYLLLAKLVAINTLGNPPWLGDFYCQLQVVLWEGHNFCCNKQEAIGLNECEIGEQGGSWPKRIH